MFFTLVFCFFPVASAFAAPPAPDLKVSLHSAVVDANEIQATVSVRGPADTKVSLATTQADGPLRTSLVRAPLDLWILLDNSASCGTARVDQAVAGWVGRLGKELPSASRISLLSFRRGSLEVIASQVPAGEIPRGQIRCDARAVSAEPEKAMEYVRQAPALDGLTRQVWLVTSGNLSVGDAGVSWLRQSGTELHVLLYNPALLPVLGPVLDRLETKLGELLQAGAPVIAPETLPVRTYVASAHSPLESSGNLTLFAQARQGDSKATSDPLTLSLGENARPSLLRRIVRIATLMLGIAALVWLSVRLVRAYSPKHCGDCGQRMRQSQKLCAFCAIQEHAYLLQDNPLGEKGEVAKPLVAAIDAPLIHVGTRRGSLLRCLPRKGVRKAHFFQIAQTSRGERTAYQLIPAGKPVFVNGVAVTAPRYLASGDEIRVASSRFQFIQQGVSRAS
ncbi:hypothetical protein K2X33_12355 [bacterium]|nr:hypothetical protein [bacterium]